MKFMMCEITYTDNNPVPLTPQNKSCAPHAHTIIFLSEAAAQWSLIPSTLHSPPPPPLGLRNRLYATRDIWKPHPPVGRAGCTP